MVFRFSGGGVRLICSYVFVGFIVGRGEGGFVGSVAVGGVGGRFGSGGVGAVGVVAVGIGGGAVGFGGFFAGSRVGSGEFGVLVFRVSLGA